MNKFAEMTTFVSVVDAHSFSEAARRLGTTKSQVSQRIQQLERRLGRVLLKGFLFALTQQEKLPRTLLFYNGGASVTCEGSASLEDLHKLEALGVEILTCGTCLNHYGIADKLRVGQVTNMYVIAEKQMNAALVIRP